MIEDKDLKLEQALPPTEYEKKRDEIVLETVHLGTFLQNGRTINAGMFPDTQQAIDNLVQQERLKAKIEELDELIPNPVTEMASINYEDELKRLYAYIHEHKADLTKLLKEYEAK